MIQPVFLITDVFYFCFLVALLVFLGWSRKRHFYEELGVRLKSSRMHQAALAIIGFYLSLALLDSMHFRVPLQESSGLVRTNNTQDIVWSAPRSLLDSLLVTFYSGISEEQGRIVSNIEKSYSKPLALVSLEQKMDTDPNTGQVVLRTERLSAPGTHWLGTDQAGGDVFYQIIKGVRTGIIVGLVTTLIAVPFAVIFGIPAGYFGGRIDDAIQFVYTTVSSIPSILLIVSLIMIVDTKLSGLSASDILWRDDLRVFGICCILGVLGWSSLCRLLRAETLKVKTLDYIQAARVLGVGHWKIIFRHILPNVMHIILITFILSFSGLVMVEVILQYINIGVPDTVASWGRIIDNARSELGRDPMILWPVGSAFTAMFILVFAVNLMGDMMRDALDPRLKGNQES